MSFHFQASPFRSTQHPSSFPSLTLAYLPPLLFLCVASPSSLQFHHFFHLLIPLHFQLSPFRSTQYIFSFLRLPLPLLILYVLTRPPLPPFVDLSSFSAVSMSFHPIPLLPSLFLIVPSLPRSLPPSLRLMLHQGLRGCERALLCLPELLCRIVLAASVSKLRADDIYSSLALVTTRFYLFLLSFMSWWRR